MNLIIFGLFFVLLATLYFVLGLRAARTVKTDSDYYLAGRNLGVVQVTCNLIATQLGGGLLLGTAATAYSIGYYGILYTLGMCLGFLLLAMGVASRLQQFQVTTTAQLFETQYKSPALKKVASLLSIITFFGILVAQVVGLKSLMAGIGLNNSWLVVALWLSVVGYTMLGGLRAITINDMVQLTIITLTFSGIFMYQLIFYPTLFADIIAQQSTLFISQSQTGLLSIILMPALFSLFQQDLAQRFFASRTKTVATLSALYAGIFLIIFAFIPVYCGMATRLLGLEIGTANPLMVFLNYTTPDIIFALAVCAIIAAIISTADALLNGISANITQDFKITIPGISTLTLSKLVTLCIGLGALSMSYLMSQDIIGLIISSYELSVSCLLVPLVVCYFKREVRKTAALFSIIAGLAAFIIFHSYPIALPKEIVTLSISALFYIIGSQLR